MTSTPTATATVSVPSSPDHVSVRLGPLVDAALLVAVFFAVGEAASLSPELSHSVAASLVALVVLVGLRGRSSWPRVIGTLVGLTVTAMLAPTLSRTVSLLVPFAWFGLLLVGVPAVGRSARRVALAHSFLAMTLIGVRTIPQLGFLWRTAADGVSVVTGVIAGEAQLYGPSILGLAAATLLLGYGVALATEPRARGEDGGRPRVLRNVGWSVLALATSLAVLVGFNVLTDRLAPRIFDAFDVREHRQVALYFRRLSVLIPFSIPLRLGVGFVLVAAGSLLLALLARISLGRPTTGPGRRSRRPVAFASGAIALAVAMAALFVPGTPGSGRVLISDNGRFEWDRPDFQNFGGRSSGMFGGLPGLFERLGYDVAVGGFSRGSLQGVDVAVTINRRDAFEAAELAAVQDYVRAGGNLLVLADHTRFEHDDPLNVLMKPAGIQLRFDTVQPFTMGWSDSYEFAPAMLPEQPRRSYRVYHWVGASLDIEPHVRPLLIGRHAFADYGIEERIEMNKLGDRRANPGERIGDLVLAASSDWGAGRVVAFADTTSFQNKQAAQTWEYVSGVMSFAARGRPARAPGWLAAALFAAGLLAWTGLLIAGDRGLLVPVMAPILAVSITCLGDLESRVVHAPHLASDRSGRSPLALLDVSHGERLVFDSQLPNAIDGLVLNCLRNDYVPVVEYDDLERQIDAADLVVLASPSKPFSDREIDRVESFVERGGTLLVTVGYEEAAASKALLARFGFAIESTPLGGVTPTVKEPRVALHEAWPVRFDSAADDVEVLLSELERPVAVKRLRGRGRVVVVGDSYFLQGATLESSGRSVRDGYEYTVSLPNVTFLRDEVFNR